MKINYAYYNILVVAECQQRFVVLKTWRPGASVNTIEDDDEFKAQNHQISMNWSWAPPNRLNSPSSFFQSTHFVPTSLFGENGGIIVNSVKLGECL